jgi:hypothetical protein
MLLSNKEELVGLIVRVIAETGIKPLCIKVRDLLIRHQDTVPYEYRGQWMQVNPVEWQPRSGTTVRVGTGSGNRKAQIQAITSLLQIQSQIAQMPGQGLVHPAKVYNTLNDYCKWSGLITAANYFMDPSAPEGQQFDQQQKEQAAQQEQMQQQLQMQTVQAQVQLAQAELQKAQAEQQNVLLKGQIEELKGRLTLATKDAEAAAKDADRLLKRYEIDTKAALELTKIETQAKSQEDQNMLANRQLMSGEETKARQEDRADRQEDRADYEATKPEVEDE